MLNLSNFQNLQSLFLAFVKSAWSIVSLVTRSCVPSQKQTNAWRKASSVVMPIPSTSASMRGHRYAWPKSMIHLYDSSATSFINASQE